MVTTGTILRRLLRRMNKRDNEARLAFLMTKAEAELVKTILNDAFTELTQVYLDTEHRGVNPAEVEKLMEVVDTLVTRMGHFMKRDGWV